MQPVMGVAAGDGYCAIPSSSPTGGVVECLGANSVGQLGNGTTSSSLLAMVTVSETTSAVSLASDGWGYCALLSRGRVDCWGPNAYGDLGSGTYSEYSDVPAAVVDPSGAELSNVLGVTSDGGGYCALLSSERVDCWGSNYYGDLGNGGVDWRSDVASPVELPSGAQVAVLVGSGGNYCVGISVGPVYCWGFNSYRGFLGNGHDPATKYDSPAPVQVVGITNATNMSSDFGGFCAVISTTSSTGAVECWGDNSWGQLGNGQSGPGAYSDVPVATVGIASGSAIASNAADYFGVYPGYNYCAVLLSSVECWGNSSYVPVPVYPSTGRVSQPAPTVTSISPISGPLGGGTQVTITGTNLGPTPVVDFGSNAANVSSDTAAQIVVTSPAGVPGPANISVTTVGGTVTDPNAFTYVTALRGPTMGPVIYDALGDSYSSGEGTGPPYLVAGQDGSVAASNTPADQGHRSQWAFSVLLQTQLLPRSWVPTFAACSGATTADIVKLSKNHEGPQLKRVGNNPDLVTLTIGRNNVGFAPKLEHCIEQTILATSFNRLTKPPWPLPRPPWLPKLDPSCADSPSFTTSVEKGIANAKPEIEAAYAAVRKRADPNASVVAIGYPGIFPTQFSGQNCVELSPWLTPSDQVFVNAMAFVLDSVEAQAATEAGVNFVNVTFAGHGVCGSKGAWINALTWTNGDIVIQVPINIALFGFPPIYINIPVRVPIPNMTGSFHPDALGQLGYAKAIVDYMSQRAYAGAPLNTVGFPLNPAPVVVPLRERLPNASTGTPVRSPVPATGSG
ncbi:MAG: IPT/TIG domain-containing protein [Acidimicrobiales bacterium]